MIDRGITKNVLEPLTVEHSFPTYARWPHQKNKTSMKLKINKQQKKKILKTTINCI